MKIMATGRPMTGRSPNLQISENTNLAIFSFRADDTV